MIFDDDGEEIVVITKKEYERLKQDSLWLAALEDSGVDNWSGISFAHEFLEEEKLKGARG